MTIHTMVHHLHILRHVLECLEIAEPRPRCSVKYCTLMKQVLKYIREDGNLIKFSFSYASIPNYNALRNSTETRTIDDNYSNSTGNIETNALATNVANTSSNIVQHPTNLTGQSSDLHLDQQSSNFLCITLDESSFKIPDVRKFFQHQLFQILHVFKCQKRENILNRKKCCLQFCKTLKEVLNHVKVCKANIDCTVPYCATTKFIIPHWENCISSDCSVCQPLSDLRIKKEDS